MRAATKPEAFGSRSARVYRALVRSLFPKAFLLEYEPWIVQAFVDRIRDVRTEHRFGATARVWGRTIADLLVSAFRLRLTALAESFRGPGPNRYKHKRKTRLGEWMSSLLLDLRYALRLLWKARGFTAVAVLTIALGVGANTAIFSVLNGVVLQPLPYPDQERLVRIWPGNSLSKESLVEFEERMQSFAGLSGFGGQTLTLTGNGEPEELSGASVSVNHFDVLGVAPVLGRAFLPEEREPGSGSVVILSHGLWNRRFGADPGIIGEVIQLGGAGDETRTVIGIMGPDYRPLSASVQAWLPLTIDPTNQGDYSGTASLMVVGRLSEAASLEQANAELRAIVARWQDEGLRWLTDEVARTALVASMHDTLVGAVRSPLMVLFAAVALVLLIACTNVANLLLARGSVRQREIGIRLAIGAGRLRVLRQLLTESALLGLLGGGVGLAFAVWTLSVLKSSLPASVPRADLISIDLPVLGFALAISLLSGLVLGILPAVRSTKSNLRSTLYDSGRGMSGGRGRQRIHRALVVVETALAVVLVVGAGLMLKSFWLVNRVDPGFRVEGLVAMRLSPPASRYGEDEILRDYYRRVTERLEAVPGVVSVGANYLLPMAPGNMAVLYNVEDDILPEGEFRPRANVRSVSTGYFQTMEIPLVEGRLFNAADGTDESLVMILNQTMARDLAPDGTALGKRIGGFFGETFTVVGVVADVHQRSLQAAPRPEMYLPYHWATFSNMYVLVRINGDAASHIPTLQQAVWTVDADVPISRINTMEDVVAESLGDSRFLAQLLTAFAALALALGAIGVYGVLSYTVNQRASEIGVRMALGAPQRAVLKSAMAQGIALVAGGVVVGIAIALAAARLLSGFLFGISTTDPATFLTVGVFLMLVAVVASLIPAVRASRIDPMLALRLE